MTGQQSWLASVLLADPFLLGQASALLAAGGADEESRLAARRLLDQQIRPREQDYAEAAGELAAAGHPQLAAMLRAIAGDELLDQARARWEHRYASRPGTERDISDVPQAGDGIDWSDDGPRRGVDGAWYECGHLESRRRSWWVVRVQGRGHGELVFLDDYEQQRRWVADRGGTATGELIFPRARPEPRVVQEEQILAGLLGEPGMLGETAGRLAPQTFTADARYEIYAAMQAAASRGLHSLPDELSRRAAWLPGGELPGLGGYLGRLMRTPVTRAAAESAINAVAEEDARAEELNGWYHAVADPVTGERIAEPQAREAVLWRECAARPDTPPPGPPYPGGPAPRM